MIFLQSQLPAVYCSTERCGGGLGERKRLYLQVNTAYARVFTSGAKTIVD